MSMTYEEKMAALKSLSHECSLSMRKPGDWYVSHHGVEIASGGMLVSRYGNGPNPAAAINDHWKHLTTLKPGEYVVVGAMARRRQVRWNGFMWEEVT